MLKRVAILAAVILLTFFPLIAPTVHAVQPWTGNPWEGTPWEGTPWDGSQLQWEGRGTEGNGTNAQDFYGNTWSGAPWAGNGTAGNGTVGNGTVGNGTIGNGTIGNGTIGNGTIGNGTIGNGTIGNGTIGNGTIGNGTYGSGTGGSLISGRYVTPNNPLGLYDPTGLIEHSSKSSSPEAWYETDIYKSFDYVLKDGVGGAINSVTGMYSDAQVNNGVLSLGGFAKNKINFGAGITAGAIKMQFGDNLFTNGYDIYSNGAAVKDGISGIRSAINAGTTTDNILGAVNGADVLRTGFDAVPRMGAISKFNAGTAALGTVSSGISTYAKFKDIEGTTGTERTSAIADTVAEGGSTLLNAGGVVAAIPGGQLAGGIMMAGGGLIWAGGKLTKLYADNWKGGVWKTTKSLAKKAGDKISDGFSKFTGKVKGLFS